MEVLFFVVVALTSMFILVPALAYCVERTDPETKEMWSYKPFVLVEDVISATVAFTLRPRRRRQQQRMMQQRHRLIFLHSLTDEDKKWVREQLRQMGIRKMPYWLTPNPKCYNDWHYMGRDMCSCAPCEFVRARPDAMLPM